jgi:hypothetical protein
LVTSAKGHQFVSETDTEIIAHLIEDEHSMAAAANGSAKSGAPQPALSLSKGRELPRDSEAKPTFLLMTLEEFEAANYEGLAFPRANQMTYPVVLLSPELATSPDAPETGSVQ